ncbi:MAG: ISAs1 family transposase [Acidimicrobiales bacterium]
MPSERLPPLAVRPLHRSERARFDAELDEHHWLGHHLVGQTMRYVATDEDGDWLALAGFGAAALACGPRDRYIGWTPELHFRRLAYVANNQRFCVLPRGRVANLASSVLSRVLRRLSGDYQVRWGHPVLVVESFVDPSRHLGTCYRAAGFTALGETAGYGRRSGRYVHHGQVKLCFARALRRDALRLLAAPFDHPILQGATTEMLDLNDLAFDGEGGLLARLEEITDHRKRRGVRHSLTSVLAIAVAATLAGARSLAAIGEFAADCPQEVLARLGARYHPVRRCYVPPHDATFRRAIAAVDTDALDEAVGAWLFDQVRAGHVEEERLVVALDGKSLRGALRDDGRAVHLLSAMVHGEGVVVAQGEVDEKSNEITAFRPLLEGLDLEGALVTADAMHTQRDHANFLVEEKKADYLFQVKGNQPNLQEAVEGIEEDAYCAPHEDTTKAHGRIEHRCVQIAEAPTGVDFPHVAQVVRVKRARADMIGIVVSTETAYYVTSVAQGSAGPSVLGAHTRGHWGIENKVHYVRDWTYDEDRDIRRGPPPAHGGHLCPPGAGHPAQSGHQPAPPGRGDEHRPGDPVGGA